jgi:hypothetical protein
MHRWTHEDREFVTPSNHFRYLNAWVDLTNRPVTREIPAIDATTVAHSSLPLIFCSFWFSTLQSVATAICT